MSFCFYIIDTAGEEVIWEGLSEQQAFRMDNTTRLHPPNNILKFGWGRIPSGSAVPEKMKEMWLKEKAKKGARKSGN